MKEYRFFISSTFKDMQQERDAIRDVVLPEIDLLASKYGIVVSIVDLRWGISTEDCESNDDVSLKIFRSCFDEIDESKPFFIGLLGNRYGWVPNLDKNKLCYVASFTISSVTENIEFYFQNGHAMKHFLLKIKMLLKNHR